MIEPGAKTTATKAARTLVVPRAELSALECVQEGRFEYIERNLRPNESLGAMYKRITGEPLIFTIDGPGATGKGTLGPMLARFLGVPYFSSGITFRVPALVAMLEIPEFQKLGWIARREIQDLLSDKEALKRDFKALKLTVERMSKGELKLQNKGRAEKIELVTGEGETRDVSETISKSEKRKLAKLIAELVSGAQVKVINVDGTQRVIVHRGEIQRDVTDEVYLGKEFSMGASIIAEVGIFRKKLLPFQRSFGDEIGGGTDGRDAGSKIFPHAVIKFYFGGAPEARAVWRLNQRLKKEGREKEIPTHLPTPKNDEELKATLAHVSAYIDEFYAEAEAIESRDRHDRTREHSPLREPKDAIRFFPALYVDDEGNPCQPGDRPSGINCLSEEESFKVIRTMALERLEALLRARALQH